MLVLIESVARWRTGTQKGEVGVVLEDLSLRCWDLCRGRLNLPGSCFKTVLGLRRSYLVLKLSKLFVIGIFLDTSLDKGLPSTDLE